jgi:hypothetical protein
MNVNSNLEYEKQIFLEEGICSRIVLVIRHGLRVLVVCKR